MKKELNIITFLLIASLVIGQRASFVQFSKSQGLEDPFIKHMTLCDDGFLWVSSKNTLSRFNGLDFVEMAIPNDDGEVITMEAIGPSNLLLGTKNGLLHFRNNSIQSIKSDLNSKISINDIAVFHNEIILATNQGLYVYEDDRILKLETGKLLDTEVVFSLLPYHGALLVGTESHLWSYSTTAIFKLEDQKNWPSGKVEVMAMDNIDNIYIAVEDHGLIRLQKDLSLDPNFKGPNTKKISDIIVLPNETIVVATPGKGLFIGHEAHFDIWTNYQEGNGFINDQITCLSVVGENLMWGTAGSGIFKLIRPNLEKIGPMEIDLLGNNYNDEPILLTNRSIYSIVNDLSFSLKEEFVISDSTFQGQLIYQDFHDNFWLCDQKGFWFLAQDGVDSLTPIDLSPIQPRFFQQSSANDYWLSSASHGVIKLQRKEGAIQNKKSISKRNGLNSNDITAMIRGHEEDIYFSTRLGQVVHIDASDKIKIHGRLDGLPASQITALALDENNNLYVGTRGAGLYVKKNHADQQFKPVAPNLKSNNIYKLKSTKNNSLWVLGDLGLELLHFSASDLIESYHFYGKEEGLTLSPSNITHLFLSKEGQLMISTNKEIFRFSSEKESPIAPKLVIIKVRASNDRVIYNFSKAVNFDSEVTGLNIEVEGVDFQNPNNLKFKFSLDNGAWSPWTNNRNIFISNLLQGHHNVLLQAQDSDGNNSVVKKISFNIGIPFYKEKSFLIQAGMVGLLLLFATGITIIRRIKTRERLKRRQLEVKNELMALEQKALQLQMNPHFIFNALHTVQTSVASGQTEKARESISQFANLMRTMLDQARKQVISLEEEIHYLGLYLEVERQTRPFHFDYDIEVDPELEPEEVLIPPMLVQPLVENAIEHGLAGAMKEGVIKISFLVKQDMLEVAILDNGVGLDLATKTGHKKHQSSIALDVTKKRIDAISSKKRNSFHLRSIVNEQGEEWTQAKFDIPLNYKL